MEYLPVVIGAVGLVTCYILKGLYPRRSFLITAVAGCIVGICIIVSFTLFI